ncbi:MAG: hypothetical protein O2819_05865 [Planctomycetota bacterium]|nr:hypothetical protein [Planctomycetota bacterium]
MMRTATVLGLTCFLAGCYSPKGGLLPGPKSAQTYYSTPMEPVTIRMTDACREEVFFELDVPPQQQFSYKFVEDGGDDPSQAPDRMLWGLMPIGTKTGRLRNTLSVPAAPCRRVDYYLRPGPETVPDDPAHRLRTDDRSGAGLVPASTDPNIYDG